MAGERDEPRRDEIIDESRSQYIVTEGAEGVSPADAPPGVGPREGAGPHGDRDRGGGGREAGGGGSGGSVSVMNLAITAALALIFGLLGAWAYGAFLGGSSGSGGAQAEGEGEGPGSAEDAEPGGSGDRGTSMAGDPSQDRPEGLPAGEQPGAYGAGGMGDSGSMARQQSERIDQLAEQVARLREELSSRPDPASGSQVEQMATRLSEVSERLDAIEGDAQGVEGLAQQLQQRSDRLDEMSDLLDQVESRLTTISDRVDAAAPGGGLGGGAGGLIGGGLGSPGDEGGGAPEAGPTSDAGPDDSTNLRRVLRPGAGEDDEDESALEQGIRQFRSDQFSAARDTFFELLEQEPDDARVWYFAALARGKATGDWKGETERLVLQGVELERAGSPPRVAIDAAFSGLAERQGGEWLRFYRRRAGE
ncbi:hypothetical protein [Tautonia plasticadhaerens]|uniref:Tetratricopeptide repeat protein n=1 Tax=Tautonia plasticadhaerens TaxID=2527974 RepID=A0A518H0G1_9BACT|nr:hypothetical protein [Tautonia plasticadhaerens]QDV34318.1 hypothetical protein ElP_22030 [Tautonia plasticadhaerens]